MTKIQFTRTATQPHRNRKFRQFNNDQYCTMYNTCCFFYLMASAFFCMKFQSISETGLKSNWHLSLTVPRRYSHFSHKKCRFLVSVSLLYFYIDLHPCCFHVLVLCCSGGCLLCMLCFRYVRFHFIYQVADPPYKRTIKSFLPY